MEQNQNLYKEEFESSNELKKVIYKYLNYWPWFLLSVIICVLGAFIYLRYTTSIYQTKAKVKVLDEGNDGGLGLAGLRGSSTLFNFSKVNLENEIQIFKSRRLLAQVVDRLNLQTSYHSFATFKPSLLFNNEVPIEIEWLYKDSLDYASSPSISFKTIDANSFSLEEENIGKLTANYQDTINFGDYHLRITKQANFTNDSPKKYFIRFKSLHSAIASLSNSIVIEPVGEKSHILEARINGSNKAKNEAIIDVLVQQFNQDGIEDKRLVSKRTKNFVENRLIFLEQELDTVETNIVQFKEQSDLVSIEANTEQLFGKEAGAENKRYEAATQLAVTKDLKSTLQSQSAYSLLPANIGIENASINQLTQEYNTLVLERDRLLVSSTNENPMVKNLNQELEQLQSNISRSINAYIQTLQTGLSNIQTRENVSSGKLKDLPKKEKQLRAIRRQQEIKERLYLFLLQRREEAALSYAITAPTVKIVDYAYTNQQPVAPKKRIVLLAALVLGLLIPFGIVYLIFLLDTKVHAKDDLQRILHNIPVVGEIPQLSQDSHKLIKPNDRSVLAEAFRILRTNLKFLDAKAGISAKVVFVTSTTKGEGKTFVSTNLANILASTNKKVLLIGADLRNPQLHTYINADKNRDGVSTYLYNDQTSLESLIVRKAFEVDNVDLLLSGPIPPNPAELLANGRFDELLEECKALYDFIIVDTAPTILVTDTFLIAEHADISLYMVRANFTDNKLLNHINELQKDKKLQEPAVVLNAVKEQGAYGYNYGYGYGYSAAEAKTPFWKFWKKK